MWFKNKVTGKEHFITDKIALGRVEHSQDFERIEKKEEKKESKSKKK